LPKLVNNTCGIIFYYYLRIFSRHEPLNTEEKSFLISWFICFWKLKKHANVFLVRQ